MRPWNHDLLMGLIRVIKAVVPIWTINNFMTEHGWSREIRPLTLHVEKLFFFVFSIMCRYERKTCWYSGPAQITICLVLRLKSSPNCSYTIVNWNRTLIYILSIKIGSYFVNKIPKTKMKDLVQMHSEHMFRTYTVDMKSNK